MKALAWSRSDAAINSLVVAALMTVPGRSCEGLRASDRREAPARLAPSPSWALCCCKVSSRSLHKTGMENLLMLTNNKSQEDLQS